MLDLIISNTAIITGDGTTFIPEGQIGIAHGQIVHVCGGSDKSISAEIPCIDAKGGTTIPGLINAHAHGCIFGPTMPSGSQPFDDEAIAFYRNRHLIAGTTSLINVCGFAFADEVNNPRGAQHPMRIFVTTAHSPSSIRAADQVDGKGLRNEHRQSSAEAAIAKGAIALGEGGGGQTLGGGAQDYRFIPEAILDATGILITAQQAKALKEAALGRKLDQTLLPAGGAFVALCEEIGLTKRLEVDRIAAIIFDTVMASVRSALEGQTELAALSSQIGVPAILHNAAPTADHLLSLSRKFPGAKLIAAHSNHPSFSPEEAVKVAYRLREEGVVIDVSTLDCISTRWRNDPGNLDALIIAGLVDTLSTDFAGGHWDGILEAMHRMITKKQISAPAAVALATGNVADRFDTLSDCGRIEVGRRADLVICDAHNLSRVRHVIIEGQLVVQNGALIATSS